MSSNPKPVSAVHSQAVRAGQAYRVAIVGAATLKGKEIIEVLNDRNFPSLDTKLLDDDEALGKLETLKDEVTFVQSVRNEQFENVDFTFFASTPESTRNFDKIASKNGSAIIDLSYALENEAGATVRAPWVERQLGQTFAPELQPGPAVVAHPAAIALALIILRVPKAGPVKSVIATLFEPASEHGQKGMDELHEQTVNLLAFQQLPTSVFDVQVAFNMVSRYGPQSVPTLISIQERILRHYRQIAGKQAIVPSLIVLQAPVFHGHTYAIHVEMQDIADLAVISEALAGNIFRSRFQLTRRPVT